MNKFSPAQIELFRSLFHGRQDAYGLETKNGPVSIKEPLTDKEIQSHLEGKKRIGVYCLTNGDLVYFAVNDLDELKKENAVGIYIALLENNLFPYIEKSKSKGFHVWLFFDEPLPAFAVRKALLGILKKAGIDCEIFPKQDSLTSNNGLGNFVYLPLFGKSVKDSRTVFLNSQFAPYPDQFDFLSRIHRTKSENILGITEGIQEESKGKRSDPREVSDNGLDIAAYLKHYRIPFSIKKEDTRTVYQLNECFFSKQHTTGDGKGHAAIIQNIDGLITYHCMHDHCRKKKWLDVKSVISGDASLGQFYRGHSEKRARRNLTEEIRAWVDSAFSRFTTDMLYRDLGVIGTNEKAHVRVELGRMVTKEILERGSVNGSFVKIESQTKTLEIKPEKPTPLKINLPGDLQKRIDIYKHNLLVGAGSSNSGKTAYAMNTAYDNRDLFTVYYLTTEMDSDELTLRAHNFGYPLSEWAKITFKPWESIHSIEPDAFNVVDYLEVKEGEFWRVGDDLRKIFEKLNTGIALVFLQMDKGSKFGWGGQKTVDKARLYFTLDDNKLTIVKGKNWAGINNPNGEVVPFKLIQGARFKWGQSEC